MTETQTELITPAQKQAEILTTYRQPVRELADTAAAYYDAMMKTEGIERAMVTADGMATLSKKLEPLWPLIQQLMGSPFGFKTDRDHMPDAYDKETVIACCTVALLQGVSLCNNHFNIVSGNTMIVQNGVMYAFRNLPGISGDDPKIGLPKYENNDTVAIIDAELHWQQNGKPCAIICDGGKGANHYPQISCRVNRGQGDDAVQGKALRKIYAMALARVTNQVVLTADEHGIADDAVAVGRGETVGALEPARNTNAPPADACEPIDLDAVARCETIPAVNAWHKQMVKHAHQTQWNNTDERDRRIEAINAAAVARRRDLKP